MSPDFPEPQGHLSPAFSEPWFLWALISLNLGFSEP
jgi:hypothetical protein